MPELKYFIQKQLSFCTLNISYKSKKVTFVFLCVCYFTKQCGLQLWPCCYKPQNFIYLYM